MSSIVKVINNWMLRSKSRNELRQLSDHYLKDIGISRLDAREEARKPFWKE